MTRFGCVCVCVLAYNQHPQKNHPVIFSWDRRAVTIETSLLQCVCVPSSPEFFIGDGGQHRQHGCQESGHDLHHRRHPTLVSVRLPGFTGIQLYTHVCAHTHKHDTKMRRMIPDARGTSILWLVWTRVMDTGDLPKEIRHSIDSLEHSQTALGNWVDSLGHCLLTQSLIWLTWTFAKGTQRLIWLLLALELLGHQGEALGCLFHAPDLPGHSVNSDGHLQKIFRHLINPLS